MGTQRRHTPLAVETVHRAHCTVHERLRVLGGLPFFRSLDEAALAQANQAFHSEDYAPGAVVCDEGEPVRGLHVVAVGKVKLVRHTAGGQDVLLEILGPGGFFGGLSGTPGERYTEGAEAITAACVLAVAPAAFREVLRAHPATALAVLDVLGERLRAANETIRQLSAHPVEQRLASVLLKLAHSVGEAQPAARGGGVLIQVPLARKDLADMTGTTPETASRILSQFQAQGWIRGGRRWVAVQDASALERLAEPA